MTARTQKRRASLLKPRFRRFSAEADDYGRHPLDSTKLELHPATRREVPADDPWLSPQKAEAVRALLIQIEFAQDHETMYRKLAEADSEELDVRGFCEDAELTERQLEAVLMIAEGWAVADIALRLGISQRAVSFRLYYGRMKLVRHIPPLGLVSAKHSEKVYNGEGEVSLV